MQKVSFVNTIDLFQLVNSFTFRLFDGFDSMNRFKAIDEKLKQFADNRKAQIYSTGSEFWIRDVPVPSKKIEERRIIWMVGLICKIVLILPKFHTNVNYPPLWNFEVYARLDDEKLYPNKRPTISKFLLKGVTFTEIHKNIDRLLSDAAQFLDEIKPEDFQIGG